MRSLAEHHGCRVAHAALEASRDASQVHNGPPRCGVAGHQGPVLARIDHGRGHDGAIAQRHHFDAVGAPYRRRGERGAEIDTQAVSHQPSNRTNQYCSLR
jgi:hypothetical protein